MSRRTPPIDTRGIYELKDPFHASADKVYICHAIRTFKDLREQFLDPYELYYEPNGIERSKFEDDRDEGAVIVTLIDEDGEEVIYVPDTYILSFPDMGEIKYQRIVVSVDFGALPEYIPFAHVEEQIGSVAKDVIGVEPNVETHIAPTSNLITPEEHQSLEASRRANISNANTIYALYLEKSRQLDQAQNKLSTLEQILINEGIIGGD